MDRSPHANDKAHEERHGHRMLLRPRPHPKILVDLRKAVPADRSGKVNDEYGEPAQQNNRRRNEDWMARVERTKATLLAAVMTLARQMVVNAVEAPEQAGIEQYAQSNDADHSPHHVKAGPHKVIPVSMRVEALPNND